VNLIAIYRTIISPPTDQRFCQYPVTVSARPPSLLKRPADLVLSVLAILVTSPLWVVIAILIYLEDRGPVLFFQPRVGRNGRSFNLVKFRSMVPDAEARKAALIGMSDVKGAFKMKDDPRVTRIGKRIRKYKLDELPQFLNVLAGDMALVGPRPTSLEEVNRAYNEAFCQKFIAGAKPGLTGLTQIVEARYGKLDLEDQIRYDVEYIENQSLACDLLIMLFTVPAVVLGKSV